MEENQENFIENFIVSKEQMLKILEENELPKAPFEIRILNFGNDHLLVMSIDTTDGNGRVLLPKE